MEISDHKNAVRNDVRKLRVEMVGQLPPAILNLAFSKAPSPLANFFTPGKIVAGYMAQGSEANVSRLLESAAQAGCQIALPHLSSESSPMQFLQWTPEEPLITGPYKIKQPSDQNMALKPDIILLPLVAFDRRLNRLGQGAGFYDRSLALLEHSIKIGVAWSVQEVPAVPVDVWDIPLDAVLTEKEWIV